MQFAWNSDHFRRASRAALLLGVVVAAGAVAGCEIRTDSVVGLHAGSTDQSGTTSAQDSTLVGNWTRLVLYDDEAGNLLGSRTTWTFSSDGNAVKTVVSTNFTEGLIDSTFALARWTTANGQVTVSFTEAGAGTVTFPYAVAGTLLTLGTLDFARQL
jgi:hypothetical protein